MSIPIEIGHALHTAVRRGRLSIAHFRASLGRIHTIFATLMPMPKYEAGAFEIAACCGCSPYDACYIAVASLTRASLATSDVRQAAARLTMRQRVSRLENGFADLLGS
ncbi:MAG: type II toxin-antitoxin system VapC family toxin [Alphaproteobacteria bacterium]|nr:type II toxin-antitoxin system VapC family toxin [Alphaproteobacteria bacterium]